MLPPVRRAAFASALIAASAFVPSTRADAPATPMVEAQTAFDGAEKELVASGPCTTMCKALDSMIRAADRICELAQSGTPEDQKRCADARSKVQEALARVRAACPECNPPLPYAPAAKAPETATKPGTDATGEGSAPMPAASPVQPSDAREVRAGGARRTTTATIDPLSLFLPAWIVQPRIERAFGSRISVAITFGLGSLSRVGPGGKDRASATVVGGEIRAYVRGHSDGFGVFVGADVAFRSAGLLPGERLVASSFPLGLTLGPTVGVKLVTRAGFAVESRLGVGFVASDQRPEGSSRERVLPIASVGLGWSF